MSKTLVGIFVDHASAENAAIEMKKNGLKTSHISILNKQGEESNEPTNTDTQSNHGTFTNDNVSDGVITGTVIGGTAGLLIGIGSVVIPGLGVIAAAGPIVGLLSGSITGGVLGGIVDLGIDEDSGKKYHEDIKSGKTFFSMECKDENVEKVATILRTCGAERVEIH